MRMLHVYSGKIRTENISKLILNPFFRLKVVEESDRAREIDIESAINFVERTDLIESGCQ